MAVLVLAAGGCRRQDPASRIRPAEAQGRPAAASLDLALLEPAPVGAPIDQPPWIAHVNAVDLDRDGRLDILFCESQDNEVLWLRQMGPGRFEERLIARDMSAPVHAEAADMDGDGDLDVLVSSMGYVFPNNDRIGSIVILENDGRHRFTPRVVLQNTERVTDVRAADFNGDGQIDLAVAQFGYDQGEVRWMERTGPWTFDSHILLDLSGAINVCVADFNGDARPDIAALISQQWEEIYLFENDGAGGFSRKRIWGSINEDYGSSGISVSDLNSDGRPDIVYTNGDGFGPAAQPGPRPWHGVQWLENMGKGDFQYHRIADLPGAYGPIAVDLDRDGAMDIVAVSAYCNWSQSEPSVASLMWYRNDGSMGFAPHVLARSPKDLITVAAGDFEGDGRTSLVTGGFYVQPPYDHMGRVTLWRPVQQ